MTRNSNSKFTLVFAWLIGAALQAPVAFADLSQTREFNIAPQLLQEALIQYTAQSGVQITSPAEVITGKASSGVVGMLPARTALTQLLQGTDLQYVVVDQNTVMIRAANAGHGQKSSVSTAPGQGSRHAMLTLAQGETAAPSTAGAAAERERHQDKVVEEVIVTGSYTTKVITVGKTAQSLRETPQSVSVLTRQRMQDQNLVAVEEAMEQVVGIDTVNITSFQPNFFSRGYTMTVQSNNSPSPTNNLLKLQYDVAVLERIEAWRGPTGLLQGVGEPGGIINLVRKRPQKNFGLDVGISGGSWNNFHGDADVTGALNDSGTIRGRLVVAGRDRDFYYDVASEQRRTGYGVMEFDLTPSTTVGVSVISQRNKGTPPLGLPTSTTGAFLDIPEDTFIGPEWQEIRFDTDEFVADVAHQFGDDWTVKLTLSRGEQDHLVKASSARTAINPATYLTTMRVSNFRWQRESVDADLTVNGAFELFGRRHEVLVGYIHTRYTQQFGGGNTDLPNRNLFDRNFGAEPAVPALTLDERYDQSALYGMARLRLLEPLTLVLGGRRSDYEREQRNLAPVRTNWVENANKADGEFTPYGGLIWDVSKEISVYASYADIFTPQGSFVNAARVPLDPRVGWQAEAGVKGEFFDGQLNASVSAYLLRDTNRALLDPSVPPDTSSPTSSCCYMTAGLVESEGWETEVAGSPLPGWDITAGYSYNTNEYVRSGVAALDGTPFVTYTPKSMFKLWSMYRFEGANMPAWLSAWNVGVGVQKRGRIYNRSGNVTVQQGSVATMSAQIGYRFNDKKTHANLTISNLTDREYYDTIFNPQFGNFRSEPRSFMLTLRHDLF